MFQPALGNGISGRRESGFIQILFEIPELPHGGAVLSAGCDCAGTAEEPECQNPEEKCGSCRRRVISIHQRA